MDPISTARIEAKLNALQSEINVLGHASHTDSILIERLQQQVSDLHADYKAASQTDMSTLREQIIDNARALYSVGLPNDFKFTVVILYYNDETYKAVLSVQVPSTGPQAMHALAKGSPKKTVHEAHLALLRVTAEALRRYVRFGLRDSEIRLPCAEPHMPTPAAVEGLKMLGRGLTESMFCEGVIEGLGFRVLR